MKLETLAEAGYHRNPTEYALQNFFNMDDEDDVEGFQWWSPKDQYRVTVEFEDEDREVSHVVVSSSTQEHDHEISVVGFEDPLPAEYQLRDIEVFKRIWPRT